MKIGLDFASIQVAPSASSINRYENRQQTIFEHQKRIVRYLELNPFGGTETALLG